MPIAILALELGAAANANPPATSAIKRSFFMFYVTSQTSVIEPELDVKVLKFVHPHALRLIAPSADDAPRIDCPHLSLAETTRVRFLAQPPPVPAHFRPCDPARPLIRACQAAV